MPRLLPLALLLAACASRSAPRGPAPPSEWGQQCPGLVVSEYSPSPSRCVRPDPQPAFDERDGEDHRVTRCEQDNGDGVTMRSLVEEITLADGTRVILNNSGCGFLTLSMTFLLPEAELPTTDAAGWRKEAARLLRQVLDAGDLPMEVNYGVAADALDGARDLGFMEELVVDSAFDIPTTLVVEGATNLPGGDGRALRMRVATGPL